MPAKRGYKYGGKTFLAAVLCMIFAVSLLSSCQTSSGGDQDNVTEENTLSKFSATFDDVFDTHAEIIGYDISEENFLANVNLLHDDLAEYNRLYDIYNDYDGVNNLKTINDMAGISPVKVDKKIIDLLKLCVEMYELTGGQVNAAMGAVLSLWHEYREAGLSNPDKAKLPSLIELNKLNKNTDIANLVIDESRKTVFLKKKGMSLDVGAIAKGYAAGKAVETLEAKGVDSILASIGGNIVSVGKPLDGVRARWGVGIQDPELAVDGTQNILDTVYVNDMCIVSSGEYQRFFIADGEKYNHIIDPATLFPATRYGAVTVICKDSGIADALSTAMFILPEEDGRKLLAKANAEGVWVYLDGTVTYTDGYKAISKKYGNYSSVDK